MICKLLGIVGPVLMTENSICLREQTFKFSLRPSVVRTGSVLSLNIYIFYLSCTVLYMYWFVCYYNIVELKCISKIINTWCKHRFKTWKIFRVLQNWIWQKTWYGKNEKPLHIIVRHFIVKRIKSHEDINIFGFYITF